MASTPPYNPSPLPTKLEESLLPNLFEGEASSDTSSIHRYNLRSHAHSKPLYSYGIGDRSPPKPLRSTKGRNFNISKAIHKVGIEVACGKQISIDWFLRAKGNPDIAIS